MGGLAPPCPASARCRCSLPITRVEFTRSGNRPDGRSPCPTGPPLRAGKYTYTIKRNQLDTLKTGEFDLSSGKATIEVPSDAPAMMNVQVTLPPRRLPPAAAAPATSRQVRPPHRLRGRLPVAGAPAVAGPPVAGPGGPAGAGGRGGRGGRGRGRGGPNYALQLGAAIAPTKLQPSAPRPADFDAFWDGKLKALAAVPMNPQLAPQETNVPGVEPGDVQNR